MSRKRNIDDSSDDGQLTKKQNGNKTPIIKSCSKSFLTLETPAQRLKQVLNKATAFGCSSSNVVKNFLRLRSTDESNSFVKVISESQVEISSLKNTATTCFPSTPSERYTFTKVLNGETSQQQVFQETALQLVNSFLGGSNAMYFAYGPTGSGKSFTIEGTKEKPGILPRVFNVIFESIRDHGGYIPFKPTRFDEVEEDEEKDCMENVTFSNVTSSVKLPVDPNYFYNVWVSYVEIYNEKVYDLLSEEKSAKAQSLQISFDSKRNSYIPNVNHCRVNSMKEVNRCLKEGKKRRIIQATEKNNHSSRGHAIFTIKILRARKDNNAMGDVLVNEFSVVDLAGNERQGDTGTTGDRLNEAGKINNSLMVLSKCLKALKSSKAHVIPFRESRLTQLLKNSFMNPCNIALLITLNLPASSWWDIYQAFTFASITKSIHFSQERNSEPIAYDLDENAQSNDLITLLVDRLNSMKEKWLLAEDKCSKLESNIRKELSEEMLGRLQKFENQGNHHRFSHAGMMKVQPTNWTISKKQRNERDTESLDKTNSIESTYLQNLQEKESKIMDLKSLLETSDDIQNKKSEEIEQLKASLETSLSQHSKLVQEYTLLSKQFKELQMNLEATKQREETLLDNLKKKVNLISELELENQTLRNEMKSAFYKKEEIVAAKKGTLEHLKNEGIYSSNLHEGSTPSKEGSPITMPKKKRRILHLLTPQPPEEIKKEEPEEINKTEKKKKRKLKSKRAVFDTEIEDASRRYSLAAKSVQRLVELPED